MAGIEYRETVTLPPIVDWDVLRTVERFFDDRAAGLALDTYLVAPGFKYMERVKLDVALGQVGDDIGDVYGVGIQRGRFQHGASVTIDLLVFADDPRSSRLEVSGSDEVIVRGIAQAFRQRFLVGSDKQLRWRAQPSSSPEVLTTVALPWWRRASRVITTQPLWVEIIGGLIVVAIVTVAGVLVAQVF